MGYSADRAIAGSTRAARRAGTQHATATPTSTSGTATKVASSSDAIEWVFQTGWSWSTAQIASRSLVPEVLSQIHDGHPDVADLALDRVPPFE